MPGENDFMPDVGEGDLSNLVNAVLGTDIGKDRKAHLTLQQAVMVARARAFADMYQVPELHALCDVLMNTTISVNGRGMKQLVAILTARMQTENEKQEFDQLRNRLLS